MPDPIIHTRLAQTYPLTDAQVDANFTNLKNGVVTAQAAADAAQATADLATAQIGALTAADIANVPAGSITATKVQAAINELDADIQALSVSDYAALRTYAGSTKSVYVTGYLVSSAPTGIAGPFTRDDADTTSTDNNATIIVASNGVRWKRDFSGAVNAEWSGAKPVPGYDNKVAFESAYAIGNGLFIPAGTWEYSGWSGIQNNNVSITGAGSGSTILKYTGSGDALVLGTGLAFYQGVNLSGFTVEGNPNVDRIIVGKALARCQWDDINVREAKSASGIGFVFQGCMLSRFNSLMCSTDRQAMVSPPYEAVNIEALSPFGNSSNNTFTNLYAEGAGRVSSTIEIGVRISGGDQNVFIGGSPESCGTWGLLIGAGCRYNTFIGVGMENLDATGGDCSDGGISSRFINCYSSQKFVMQGRSSSVEGGYFERIQIDSGAIRNRIKDVLVNGWATGSGGLFDSGTGTQAEDVYDADATAFIKNIYPCFLAFNSSSAANQTGNGAVVTVPFAAEVYDDNNNFAGSTFTAPVTGRYQLNATVSLDVLTTAATLVKLQIVTSNRTYIQEKGVNPKAGGLQDSIAMSVTADMDVSDTAYVTIQVSGMAGNTVTIIGNGSNMWTTFSGHKV